jgi:hypothetical protein
MGVSGILTGLLYQEQHDIPSHVPSDRLVYHKSVYYGTWQCKVCKSFWSNQGSLRVHWNEIGFTPNILNPCSNTCISLCTVYCYGQCDPLIMWTIVLLGLVDWISYLQGFIELAQYSTVWIIGYTFTLWCYMASYNKYLHRYIHGIRNSMKKL